VEATGAVAVTLVTLPELGATHVKFPDVSPARIYPETEGLSDGKIKS
jgi:hypothetical protein